MVATVNQQQKQPTVAAVGPTKTSAEEEALKRNTDCVYFLASPLTCKKGSECEYRHSEYARVNPRDCYYWLNGNCLNPKCAFRHPPLDGLLGTQVAAPVGSSMPSSQMAATPMAATVHTSYNQGTPFNSSKQAVPCIFFQKGHCLKGDKCAFLHGPTTNNKASQPSAAAPATEPHSRKKRFAATEPHSMNNSVAAIETPYTQRLPPNNVSKIVGVPPEGKHIPKVETFSAKGSSGIERNLKRPVGMNEKLSRHKGTNVTPVGNGGSVGRSNRLHQPHALDEQSLNPVKDTDDYLRESSPGFDVLVDDDRGDSDFYHGEDHYRGTGGLEGRNANEYDIARSTNYDTMVDVDGEMFHGTQGYDSFGHVQGHYGWDQQRASSDRMTLGPSTLEKRGYPRADSPDKYEESDLRYRLSHRRVNGLRSVVTHDHELENHEEERNYRDSSHRDSHQLSAHESSLSSRLRGRIKLPVTSLVNGTDLRSERERAREWNRDCLSPGKPQTTSHQGRLRDRMKGRVEGDCDNKEGQNFNGQRIRREIMDEKNADFAGPKSLAELKDGKIADNKEQQPLRKRKTVEDYQQYEGDLSFDGPMPLSEILKRKRQSGIASVNKEDINLKQSNESLIGSSSNRVASVLAEVKSTIADNVTAEVVHDESSQLHETEDGMIAEDERMEDHELEADDQGDGDYYYDQGEEGDYTYEEGENAEDPEEEYVEEDGDDGDDFEKKLGVMFS